MQPVPGAGAGVEPVPAAGAGFDSFPGAGAGVGREEHGENTDWGNAAEQRRSPVRSPFPTDQKAQRGPAMKPPCPKCDSPHVYIVHIDAFGHDWTQWLCYSCGRPSWKTTPQPPAASDAASQQPPTNQPPSEVAAPPVGKVPPTTSFATINHGGTTLLPQRAGEDHHPPGATRPRSASNLDSILNLCLIDHI